MIFKSIIPSVRAIQSARAFSTSVASSSAKKQFVVIARDYTDPEASARRLEVRPRHLKGASELKKSGTLHFGGALLTDHSETGKMVGSIMIFNAESEQEVVQIIEK
ncbi:hypothetical protein BGZ46_009701 [Entomortierella lignicola]|nr:hypothetical protein BGZ46_009701 [Entomortierella lignicola]KAF9202268.1 hypothetical protein BGZ49_007552 [Haplosporangium sp. Z 27]